MHPITQSLIAGCIILSTYCSCTKGAITVCPNTIDSTCTIDDTLTNIRIKNGSRYDFCDIKMIAPDGRSVDYGTLGAGQTTCYHTYKEAYSYAYLSLTTDGATYIFQPIDYVGERPLGIGKFSYVLDIDKTYKSIIIKTNRD